MPALRRSARSPGVSGKYHINASNPLEVALSAQTVHFWSSMAATGRPARPTQWPVYNSSGPDNDTAMIFGDADPAQYSGLGLDVN